jgi:hypothetical protein
MSAKKYALTGISIAKVYWLKVAGGSAFYFELLKIDRILS